MRCTSWLSVAATLRSCDTHRREIALAARRFTVIAASAVLRLFADKALAGLERHLILRNAVYGNRPEGKQA